MQHLKIFTDGGSRGNPGEAAIGAIILDDEDGTKITEISKKIGIATNNVAEYSAVLESLEYVEKNIGKSQIEFILDSELVVRQLCGLYKVKDQKLKALFNQINKKIISVGGQCQFTAVKREKNIEADALVNKALDGK
ncbi:MAG: ribonuclease HI family protein [bacterium]